jgi:hypothetical protein
MLKQYLPQPVRIIGSAGLLIAVLALVACGGSAVPEVAEEPIGETAPAEAETVQEVEATEATEEPQAVQATEEAAPAQEVASAAASCEPVLIPENELIAGPSEDDWSQGPATAAVTVIEYGDFQ